MSVRQLWIAIYWSTSNTSTSTSTLTTRPVQVPSTISLIQSYQPHDQPIDWLLLRLHLVALRYHVGTMDATYVCGRFGCHSDFHSDHWPPTSPRYDSVLTQSPRSTNPFQDRVEQYSPPVPPRQRNAPTTQDSDVGRPESHSSTVMPTFPIGALATSGFGTWGSPALRRGRCTA